MHREIKAINNVNQFRKDLEHNELGGLEMQVIGWDRNIVTGFDIF